MVERFCFSLYKILSARPHPLSQAFSTVSGGSDAPLSGGNKRPGAGGEDDPYWRIRFPLFTGGQVSVVAGPSPFVPAVLLPSPGVRVGSSSRSCSRGGRPPSCSAGYLVPWCPWAEWVARGVRVSAESRAERWAWLERPSAPESGCLDARDSAASVGPPR